MSPVRCQLNNKLDSLFSPRDPYIDINFASAISKAPKFLSFPHLQRNEKEIYAGRKRRRYRQIVVIVHVIDFQQREIKRVQQ